MKNPIITTLKRKGKIKPEVNRKINISKISMKDLPEVQWGLIKTSKEKKPRGKIPKSKKNA